MLSVLKFDNSRNKVLNKLFVGQIIENVEYRVNIPLEDNCIIINFVGGNYLLIYAMMRIIKDDKIILCSADYYFNKDFTENVEIKTIEESLIFDSLIESNKCVCNKCINKVKFNIYGDITIFVEANISIEIYFDVSEDEKDFYAYYGKNNEYFSICKIEKQLTAIEDMG